MEKICNRCDDLIKHQHRRNQTNLCDGCYIDTRIRTRVKEQTSYTGHIYDIELLLDKYDGLVKELKMCIDTVTDLTPGDLVKLIRRLTKIVSQYEEFEKLGG